MTRSRSIGATLAGVITGRRSAWLVLLVLLVAVVAVVAVVASGGSRNCNASSPAASSTRR